MSVRSIHKRNPKTRKVHCEACDEEHTMYRTWWIPDGPNPSIPAGYKWGVPPWAFAKYELWCPEHGRSADFTNSQGYFPPPEDGK